jgi:hypothetical protein
MHAAMTMTRIKPKSQQEPMDMMMPYGTAFVALAASSDMCTQESNAPIVLRLVSRDPVEGRSQKDLPDRRQP